MSIEVKNVSKIYGEQKALNKVSFSISPGEIVGFLGPNGAGKSTLMKIITCFIPQTNGSVSVCGYNIEDETIAIRKKVGYLPEHNPLYLDMYVKEYLNFIAGLHKIDNKKQRISDIIDRVGLGVEQHKIIGALSKGYRQRVGLAQAMIHNPEVLILDEPTTGLDPNQIGDIRELIVEIGKEKTVMMSTHIMQEVEAICSRVIVINKGNIVADDQIENIKKHSNNSDNQILVEFNSTVSKNKLTNIKGVIKAYNKEGNSWIISAKSKMDVRHSVFQFAVENQLEVLTLQKQESKMEDIFKELTSKS